MWNAASPSTMRMVNRTLVMRSIRERAPVSRAQIARLTSMSAPTVSAIVNDLIAEGLVDEVVATASEGGRPPRLLTFSDEVFYVGCDLSTSNVATLGLMTLSDVVIHSESVRYEDGAADPLYIGRVIRDYAKRQAEARHGRIWAVGIGVPGVTDVESGHVRWAPTLGWRDVDLKALLEARLEVPVVVDNDVNLALIGEVNQGAANQAQRAVFVAFEDGVGGAILIDGRLYRGGGGAGEVGYLVTGAAGNADFRPFGFMEQRLFDILASECRTRGIDVSLYHMQTQALANLLLLDEDSRPLSSKTRSRVVEAVAAALASIAALLDPETIVLTGWIVYLGDTFLGEIQSALRRLVDSAPPLRHSKLGPLAVVVGAAIEARRASTESAQVLMTSRRRGVLVLTSPSAPSSGDETVAAGS
jgi:predicted NBD/HSP70 family sugar kinase